MGLKKSLRRFINFRFGLDIQKYSPGPSDMSWWITRCDADVVLDVGANTGQFAAELFKIGYRGKIVSFEPLTEAHAALSTAARFNPRWTVEEKCALGDSEGESEIHSSKDSISSSLLRPTSELIAFSAGAAVISSEKIKVRTLSSIAAPYTKDARFVFLKIDVQGFEDKVLAGAKDILPQVKGLQIELSFVPLYEGQMAFEDLIKEIKKLGFYLYTLQPFFRGTYGQDLQAEAIFFREGYAPRR